MDEYTQNALARKMQAKWRKSHHQGRYERRGSPALLYRLKYAGKLRQQNASYYPQNDSSALMSNLAGLVALWLFAKNRNLKT